jgi:hypothetical protein
VLKPLGHDFLLAANTIMNTVAATITSAGMINFFITFILFITYFVESIIAIIDIVNPSRHTTATRIPNAATIILQFLMFV